MKLFNILAISFIALLSSFSVDAQEVVSSDSSSAVIVQPGSPGQETKILPTTTKAKLPPTSRKDVEFMQGMIHHHSQAVEMVELMASRTNNKELLLLGSRISQSQADEINMMKRWLTNRGEKTTMEMPKMKMDDKEMKMDDKKMSGHHHHQEEPEHLMPGMLTVEQMKALKNAKDGEFDKLFLTGMIQHHEGALVMVDELFKTSGAGQDAEVFSFATEVDSSQRAEIRIMQTMLGQKP